MENKIDSIKKEKNSLFIRCAFLFLIGLIIVVYSFIPIINWDNINRS